MFNQGQGFETHTAGLFLNNVLLYNDCGNILEGLSFKIVLHCFMIVPENVFPRNNSFSGHVWQQSPSSEIQGQKAGTGKTWNENVFKSGWKNSSRPLFLETSPLRAYLISNQRTVPCLRRTTASIICVNVNLKGTVFCIN